MKPLFVSIALSLLCSISFAADLEFETLCRREARECTMIRRMLDEHHDPSRLAYEAQTAETKYRYLSRLIDEGAYAQESAHDVSSRRSHFLEAGTKPAAAQKAAFKNNGDITLIENDEPRYANVVDISFEPVVNDVRDLSGLFSSGAAFGFLRVAVVPKTRGKFLPTLEIKLLRTNNPSANILAASLSEHGGSANLFEALLSTELSRSAQITLGTPDRHFIHHPAQAALDDMASIDSAGEKSPASAPYALNFVPSLTLQKFMHDTTVKDHRDALEGQGRGLILFHVYAKMNNGDEETHKIGELRAISAFRSSRFAEKNLLFRRGFCW